MSVSNKKRLIEKIVFPVRKINPEKLYQTIWGKTALITGASFGIGEQVARQLACPNVTLLLAARTKEKLLEIKTDLELKGATVHIFSVDLRSMEQIEMLINAVCSWSVDKNKWIQTGDLAYADKNGYYFLQGRKDDMIVSGGENIYPCEIEDAIRLIPFVKDAAVVGIDDTEFGKRLIAFVVADNESVTEADIKTWLTPKISRFQMPKNIILINEIPSTLLNKPDKKALPEYFKQLQI